jgi:hypothetical protein
LLEVAQAVVTLVVAVVLVDLELLLGFQLTQEQPIQLP